MGRDIHCTIISENGQMINIDMHGMRNYDWFDQLSGDGYNSSEGEYSHLPREYRYNETVANYIAEKQDEDYYGFVVLNSEKLVNWYATYKPYQHAGWVSVYDKWMYENKNEPIYEYHINLPNESPRDNWVFVEWIDKSDCMRWFIDELIKQHRDRKDSDTIVFFFDC